MEPSKHNLHALVWLGHVGRAEQTLDSQENRILRLQVDGFNADIAAVQEGVIIDGTQPGNQEVTSHFLPFRYYRSLICRYSRQLDDWLRTAGL